MPTNERFLEWGICPRCEYSVIVEENDASQPEFFYWVCKRCGFAEGDIGVFLPLDTLQQMFAEWKQQEFETFKAGIILCAEAKRRDAERKKKDDPSIVGLLSHFRGYTAQTINRLAQLEDLPEYLLEPTLPLGIYWQALLMSSDGDDVDLDKFAELVEEAIVNQWSLKEFKEAHGIAPPDRRQPVFEGTAEEVRAGVNVWRLVEVKVY